MGLLKNITFEELLLFLYTKGIEIDKLNFYNNTSDIDINSEIVALDLKKSGCTKVVANIFSLLGPSGILPYHYTEKTIKKRKENDLLDLKLLDFFYNKLMHCFLKDILYHDIKKYNVIHDKSINIKDKLPKTLLFHNKSLENFFCVRYMFLLSQPIRSMALLQNFISFFLGCKVTINEFVPFFEKIPVHYITKLAQQNYILGIDTISGNKSIQITNLIHITAYHLSLAQYIKIKTNKDNTRKDLNQIIQNYLTNNIFFKINFKVNVSEQINIFNANTRLGVNIWL